MTKTNNQKAAPGVISTHRLDGMCICDGLQLAIKNGIESMKKEGAPGCLIDDYIQEMQTGEWTNCNCSCNDI